MYIHICIRENKNGSVVECVRLAHNYRDPIAGRSKAKILCSFGRRESVDEDAMRRLAPVNASRSRAPARRRGHRRQGRGARQGEPLRECRRSGSSPTSGSFIWPASRRAR